MELLKSNPVIDLAYKPSIKMDHIAYFNRALKFAQTNYDDHLLKITRLNSRSVTSAFFFEEYVYSLLSNFVDEKFDSFFKKVSNSLKPYHTSFWDLNNFPDENQMKDVLTKFAIKEQKCADIHSTAYIINQGVKLFGWDEYRNNFLNCYSKLAVLPGLGLSGAKQLNQNIGGMYCPDNSQELYSLATSLGFDDAKALCMAIQKNFSMSWRTIGTILWYSAVTFEKTDIVSAD